jgi:hypothetical protein
MIDPQRYRSLGCRLVRCSACGYQCPEEYPFCPACGAPLVQGSGAPTGIGGGRSRAQWLWAWLAGLALGACLGALAVARLS